MKSTSFRWPEEFLQRIDEARGDVPRSVWVRRAVEDHLDPGIGTTPQARQRGREILESFSRADAFRKATQ